MKKRIAVALLLTCLGLTAQETDPEETEPIRVDVNVVNVPVTVSSEDGKFIVDLNKEDFEVFEDGKRVQIRYFTKSTDTENLPPLYAGFLIDLSNTARVYYKTYQETIGDLAYILIPEGGENQGFLIGYHTEVDMLVKMTKDPYLIADRMGKLQTWRRQLDDRRCLPSLQAGLDVHRLSGRRRASQGDRDCRRRAR